MDSKWREQMKKMRGELAKEKSTTEYHRKEHRSCRRTLQRIVKAAKEKKDIHIRVKVKVLNALRKVTLSFQCTQLMTVLL